MVKRKSSNDKKYYELFGQMFFFGRDSLDFKSVTLAKAQKYVGLCRKFKLKKIILKKKIFLPIVKIY